MSLLNRVRRLGRSARPIVFASFSAVVILGAALGLEAIGLPRADREQLMAARAASALRYSKTLVLAGQLEVGDRKVSSVCLSGSFRVPGHGSARLRGFGIILGNGSRFVAAGNKIESVGRPSTLATAEAEFRLGCPPVLADVLARHVAVWSEIRVATARVDGRPVYVLRLRHPPVEYFADRQTFWPVGVRLTGGVVTGSSEVALRRLSVGAFRALRHGLPE